MASKNLKGLIIKIGGDTSGLSKSLDSAEKKGRSLSNELGQINRLLKLDPTNVDLLSQKQKVLAEAIGNTENKLNDLKEAEKRAQAQFENGDISEEQYRELQREIIATERKLEAYKKAAEETDDEIKKLGDSTEETAEEIEETGEKSEDADEALDKLGSQLADVAKNGFAILAAAAAAAVGAIVSAAEASREYRTEMGKLDAAYVSSGHSSEAATAAYKELQSIIGETDQSVEAAQQIALLAKAEEDVAAWADLAAGVVGKFGDALQPETFYEAANETIKLGEATGAYVQMLEGVGMDVEKFNEGLAECTTESEKQEYMLKVTKKALGSAATQYKKTNKEIIRSNEATDDWNQAMAKIGRNVEPVITDVKEMGVALLEDAAEPMKAIAAFVRQKLLPAISSISTWTKQNLPTITAGLVGLTAVMVTHKAATLAAELATKGWTIATAAQAAAQKALNLVMAAGPVGLLTTAIVGVTAAMVAWSIATENAKEPVDILTKEERELMEAADEAARAFRDQQSATQETLDGINAQMGHVQKLSDELQGLADASGAVRSEDQQRAQFILNELNEALGTEYTMVDGVIQQYTTLKDTINDVIQAKLANSLVEAANADYVAAIQSEAEALENLGLKEQDYRNQLSITQQAEKEFADAWVQYEKAIADTTAESDHIAMSSIYYMAEKRKAMDEEKALLDEKKTAYDQAASDYSNYYNTIANYEDAQTAVLEGNYDRAVEILTEKGNTYSTYSGKVSKETAKVLDTLYKEAIDAGLEAQRTKKNFENGVEGYTKEMVTEAEKGYESALEAYANAYADAEGIGGDLGDGLSNGMENRRSSLVSKAKSLVSGILAAMRQEADSNSPARKTIDFGEDVGAGAEIGIENKTDDVKRAATDQAAAILDAYNEQELAGQKALRNVAEQQASRSTSSHMAAANANGPVLERILKAIEAGQVLALDGELLVGGTIDKTDRRLGQRRILVERGAL